MMIEDIIMKGRSVGTSVKSHRLSPVSAAALVMSDIKSIAQNNINSEIEIINFFIADMHSTFGKIVLLIYM